MLPNTSDTFVLSAGLLKIALISWYIGVIPVPPAINVMCSCLLAANGYFGIGPLKASVSPGLRLWMCVDIGPLGYTFTIRSRWPLESGERRGIKC